MVSINRKRLFKSMLVMVLAFKTVGCVSPNSKDVQGTWKITPDSRQRFLTGVPNSAGIITLKPDGTFSVTEIPGDLVGIPGTFIKGSGAWNLAERNGGHQVRLSFQSINGSSGDAGSYGTDLIISESLSAVTLYYYLGSIDDGRRIYFEKT